MSNECKKMFFVLGSVSGIAVIVVLTVFALQMILQRNVTSTAPIASTEKPVVQTEATAKVTDVKPHYISASMPERRCRKVHRVVNVAQESQLPGAGAVIGGVAGGLLGSQVGGGDGRIVTSAAGAAIGALTGNSVQNSMNAPQQRTIHSTECSTHYVKTTIQKGYEVTYSYNGQQGMMIMNDAPTIGSVLPFPVK